MGTFPVRYRDPVTGNDVKWSKIDDLNFSLTFDSPVYNIMESRMNRGPDCWINAMCWYSPKHFLTQFMPEYAGQAKIDAMMKEMDFAEYNDFWNQNTYSFYNPDSPCARAWCLELYDALYYWHINPQPLLLGLRPGGEPASVPGRHSAVPDGEPERGPSSGGLRASTTFLPPPSPYFLRCLPTSRNMERGDYSVYRWPAMAGNDSALGLAATWNEDPFIGQLMRTKDFRIAVGPWPFDRDEIKRSRLPRGLVFLRCGLPGPIIRSTRVMT